MSFQTYWSFPWSIAYSVSEDEDFKGVYHKFLIIGPLQWNWMSNRK